MSLQLAGLCLPALGPALPGVPLPSSSAIGDALAAAVTAVVTATSGVALSDLSRAAAFVLHLALHPVSIGSP